MGMGQNYVRCPCTNFYAKEEEKTASSKTVGKRVTEIFTDHNIGITFSIKKDNEKCILTPSEKLQKL